MRKLAAAQLRGGGATVFRALRGPLAVSSLKTLVLDVAVAQTRGIVGTAVAVALRRGERPGVLTVDRPKLRA
jgi:hypothetical protein